MQQLSKKNSTPEPALNPGQITFGDPAVLKCPFPAYDALRDEHPVYQDPVSGHYILTRFADVRKAVLNTKTLSNKTGLVATRESDAKEEANRIYSETGWLPLDTLVTNDPPSHRMYRSLVDKAFLPPQIEASEPRIDQVVQSLIDGFIDKPEVEFVHEFAVKLPIIVFAEQLGIADCDIDKFKHWSDCSMESSSPILSSKRELELVPIITELQRYLALNVERVNATPDDTLLSRLVHAEVDGRRLDMRELVSTLQLLFVAGSETTTAALAGGIKLLIDTPSLAAEIDADPVKMKTFVEETLRIMSPAQTMFRRATQDIEISGVFIPAGAIVEVRFGAANGDPAVFPCPAEADLGRANAHTHLAFGAGIHTCIGNQLARSEMRLAFKAIVSRMSNLRPARAEQSYDYNTSVYVAFGLTKLWLSFDRR